MVQHPQILAPQFSPTKHERFPKSAPKHATTVIIHMRIKPLEYKLSENTLRSVEDVTDENAILDLSKQRSEKKGNAFVMINKDTSMMSFIVPSLYQKKFYGGKIPRPSSLFLGQAIEFGERAMEYQALFPKLVEFTLHQNPNPKDSVNDNIYLVKEEEYYKFLMYKISCITSLISTVECFINEIIPENFSSKNKKGEVVGKQEIERHWSLKSKLKTVVPTIKRIPDLKTYEDCSNKLLELSTLRNEFTHVKTKADRKNMDPFIDYFEQLINLDLKQKISETENLIKLIEPDYL